MPEMDASQLHRGDLVNVCGVEKVVMSVAPAPPWDENGAVIHWATDYSGVTEDFLARSSERFLRAVGAFKVPDARHSRAA